jgi:hypothetical protein
MERFPSMSGGPPLVLGPLALVSATCVSGVIATLERDSCHSV